jgi:ubiquinone/menaquinone biosynthesis C-methylase UbiE
MTALDLSREHLTHTGRHLALEGLATRLVLGDAERMPFPDNCFDLVYSFGVLHHTPGTDLAVAESLRVLRRGGVALISLYHRNSLFFWGGTVLRNGVLRGRLVTRGWRGLLADIEHRSDGASASPLVKVYSRRGVRRLLHRFKDVSVEAHHVEAPHSLGRLLRNANRQALERRLGGLGWYLVARAHKP